MRPASVGPNPSVNRDGSIPDPIAPPAGAGAGGTPTPAPPRSGDEGLRLDSYQGGRDRRYIDPITLGGGGGSRQPAIGPNAPLVPFGAENMRNPFSPGGDRAGGGPQAVGGNVQQFSDWARTTFNRDITPAELQQIATATGIQPDANGNFSLEDFSLAQAYAQEWARTGNAPPSGWRPAGGGPPPPPPGGPPTDPGPGGYPGGPNRNYYQPGTAPGSATYQPGQLPGEGLPAYDPFQYSNGQVNAPGAFQYNTAPAPTYNPFQYEQGTGPSYGQFNFSNGPLPTYQGQQVGQFVSPQSQAGASAQNQLMMSVLSSPESMSPDVVRSLQEGHKESVLSMHDQLNQQNAAGAASRGTYGGGNMAANMRRTNDAAVGDITRGYRDINIAAAQTNAQDRLNALGMSDQIFSGQVNRGLGAYGANLQGTQFNAGQGHLGYQSQVTGAGFAREGEQLQAGEGRYGHEAAMAGARFGREGQQLQAGEGRYGHEAALTGRQFDRQGEQLQAGEQQQAFQNQMTGLQFGREGEQLQAGEGQLRHQSEVDARNFALNRALSQEGLNQQGADSAYRSWLGQETQNQNAGQLGLQRDLGFGGLQLDQARLTEQGRQFDQAYRGSPLEWSRLLNDMVMGRANYGVDLAQLQQMGQGSMWNFLFGNATR